MTSRHLNSPYPIRPTPELRNKLEAAARDGERSLHAEIISRLERSFDLPEAQPEAKQSDLLQQLVDHQRAVTALLLTLEEGVELLEDEMPDEQRNKNPVSGFLHRAESLVWDVKVTLKTYGGGK